MGTLAWQLNDCWPVQSWAWIDYRLRPKAAWYAAKQFYAPLLLSLSREGDHLRAHLVNDAVDGRAGTLVIRVIDTDGAELWSTKADASVGGLASEQVLDVALPDEVMDAARRAVVHATYDGVAASLLLAEPKDLTLTAARLAVSVADDLSVTLAADRLALSVMLDVDGVDVTWSDNFFHLLPGEPRVVQATPATPLTATELAARLRYRTL
jgi:beta-mannosidase